MRVRVLDPHEAASKSKLASEPSPSRRPRSFTEHSYRDRMDPLVERSDPLIVERSPERRASLRACFAFLFARDVSFAPFHASFSSPFPRGARGAFVDPSM